MNKNKLKISIIEILEKFDVNKASFFGSIVNGKFTAKSDIDILIEFNNKADKSLLDLIELKLALEEATNSKIDLITFDSINPELKNYILSNNEIIYG